MSIHPFLQKQGIEDIPVYTGATEFDLGIIDVDKQVVCSEERGMYLQVTLEDGQNICQREITDVNIDPEKIQILRQIRYLEYFRLEGKFDKLFNDVRLRWGIPIEVIELEEDKLKVGKLIEFYECLTHNQNKLYLPNIIKSQELIDDIKQLCKKVSLRPLVEEDFWVVSAVLLFGELLYPQTGALTFYYAFPLRIFKVLSNGRYQLFLEVHPSLDSIEWANFYRPIKSILREQTELTEFVPVSGNIRKLSEYIGDALSHEFGDIHVFPIPNVPEKLDSWRAEYSDVITQLNDLFLKMFNPHEKKVGEKNQRVIEECMLVAVSVEMNSRKFREVADKMQFIYPDEDWEEERVAKIWRAFINKRKYDQIEFDERYDYDPFEDDIDLKDYRLAVRSKIIEDRK